MKKFLSLLAIMMTFVFFSPLRLKAQSIESVNWYFAGWQLNLSDVLNRASQNEKLYFSNGTMVWSGMENNGSQRDTYSINGNMIYRGNGGWFKIISLSGDRMVLLANDNIYRTFTKNTSVSNPSNIYQFSIGPIIEPETTSGGGSTYVPTTTTNTTTKTAGDDSWKRQRRIELQNQLQRAQSSESLAYEQWMKEKTGTAHIAYTSAKNYRETIQRQLDSLK